MDYPNIIGAKIAFDYDDRYANDPEIRITLDGELPDRENYRYEERGGIYYAEQGPFVSYIYKADPAVADRGFGGETFIARMADGSERKWSGGWSSNPGAVFEAGFPMVFHVAAYTPSWPTLAWSTDVRLEYIAAALEEFLPEWELYIACRAYGMFSGVKRKDRPAKNPNKWTSGSSRASHLSGQQAFVVHA